MMRMETAMAALAVCGLTAGVLAAGLLWMVLTRPVALVEAIGGLL
jgi:hypothetical protein